MPKRRLFSVLAKRLVGAMGVYILAVLAVTSLIPPPAAVAIAGNQHRAEDVRFLADSSWLDGNGDRQLEQQIFDATFALINSAQRFLLIDMFLFNDWQGPVGEYHRALSDELTVALIERKKATPDLPIVLITDPVNSVYQGLESKHLTALRAAGILVVETDLTKLQDSNPFYSALWRLLVKPFGNVVAETMQNPIGEGRVSLRSVLTMANFKANHRKLIVAGVENGDAQAIVMSANPHDGSSAHRNVALSFRGSAALDLLSSELQLMALSADANQRSLVLSSIDVLKQFVEPENTEGAQHEDVIQVLRESRIREKVLQVFNQAEAGDRIELLMFYLSDRGIVKAMKSARQRGVNIRVLLDVNQDAFGRQKNGVPNRPVAAELHKADIPVKWCATKGEQCHGKMLIWSSDRADVVGLLLGSGNYTKRNLQDFNLETNVLLLASSEHQAVRDALRYFDEQWHNSAANKTFSRTYDAFADDRLRLRIEYRLREAIGFGTF